MARVLVIDDDPALLRVVRLGLSHGGHEVLTASTGSSGLEQVALREPDVVVLDLGLPDLDGIAVCRDLRRFSDVPVIVLSAADAEARKVAALDGGADDYVTKPFGMAELEARIRAALRHRRPAEEPAPELVAGPLAIDLVHRQATLGGERFPLTARELDLLAFFVRNVGKVCTHEMILSRVWGRSYASETGYLHAYVHRLREKLGGCSALHITTSPGIGYALTVETDGRAASS
ncbi:MAG TPA: response regulator transcription factor [Acidimicrobiales bacterium]|nr:response regulator transcription factor [Acidimicrobiales bacterium]